MTTLLYGIAAVFVFVLGVGIFGPALISSASTLSVIVGFLVFPFTVYAVWRIGKMWAKTADGQMVINKIKELA
jgi:Zn-dependent protease with chaperone function